MKKSNFDLYLEEQMRDPVFAARFESACESWDVKQQDTLVPELSVDEQTQGCVRSDQVDGCELVLGLSELDVK